MEGQKGPKKDGVGTILEINSKLRQVFLEERSAAIFAPVSSTVLPTKGNPCSCCSLVDHAIKIICSAPLRRVLHKRLFDLQRPFRSVLSLKQFVLYRTLTGSST